MVLHFFSLLYNCLEDIAVLFTLAKRWLELIDKESYVLRVDPARGLGVVLTPFIDQRLKVLTSDRAELLYGRDSKSV